MSPLRRIPRIRRSVRGQGVAEGEPPIEHLLAGLEDASPSVRRAAVVELATAVAGSTTEELDLRPHPVLMALLGRVAREPDAGVRETLLSHLARFDRADVVHGLVPLLSTDDAALRNGVVRALVRMPASSARLVPDLVRSTDPDVRAHALMVLAGLQVPLAEDLLLQLLDNESEATVTASAIEELVRLTGDRHLAALRRARDRFPHDPFINYLVERAVPGVASPAREAFA